MSRKRSTTEQMIRYFREAEMRLAHHLSSIAIAKWLFVSDLIPSKRDQSNPEGTTDPHAIGRS